MHISFPEDLIFVRRFWPRDIRRNLRGGSFGWFAWFSRSYHAASTDHTWSRISRCYKILRIVSTVVFQFPLVDHLVPALPEWVVWPDKFLPCARTLCNQSRWNVNLHTQFDSIGHQKKIEHVGVWRDLTPHTHQRIYLWMCQPYLYPLSLEPQWTQPVHVRLTS